jgi:hypothetical protein
MLIGQVLTVLKYRNWDAGGWIQKMNGMTAFMVAVGGTSLVCYLLMSRAQARKARRESAGGDSSSGDISSGDGWSLFSSSGSDNSSSHDSGSSSDSGGDSGGGGDGGGGGGD